jgi:hypothetical protein
MLFDLLHTNALSAQVSPAAQADVELGVAFKHSGHVPDALVVTAKVRFHLAVLFLNRLGFGRHD